MSAPTPQPNWHLKIPPPIWGMAMLLVAYAAGWILASPVIFRSTPLAVVIGVLGFLLGGWGERTFAWEDTDIMPASPTNKKLVTRGPFRYRCDPHLMGLNQLSEVSVALNGNAEFDIVATKQFVGVRRGLLRPASIIVVSARVRNLLTLAKLKGCKFEVVHVVD